MDYYLISPTNGQRLRPVGEYLLTDGERRWPVIAGIPFLRPDEALREAVVADLEGAGGHRAALGRLLANQDRFSPTPPPPQKAIDRVIDGEDLTLREAMRLLNYGPVGDYFAYRWCSPTFTGGLHMLERTPPQHTVVEVACGIGHFLRALEGAGREVVGIDIVFSKLWLARRFLGVTGDLICGDIEASQVLESARPVTVFCHDAFYFFEHKQAALGHLRAISHGGAVAIGHVHTRASEHEAGFALSREEYRALTAAFVRDDTDYTLGWYGAKTPPAPSSAIAVGWIEGETTRQTIPWISAETELRKNPLLAHETVVWPSDEWAEEYREDSQNLNGQSISALASAPAPGDKFTQYRQRRLLNLPQAW